jgi:hypothetical protein
MTAPLARDQYGNLVELPPEAKFWRVRRHTRGRPADIMGPDGEPLYIAITEDQPDLRAKGCSGSIRLDAVDADRRSLPVQAVYVELGNVEDAPRMGAAENDKDMVRVCFESMTRTMEGMQRAQVERERTLAQKEQALTEAQIANQKMIMELMIAVLDRVGGAKPQDALSFLKQQFEIQKTLERQVTRNAPALPEPLPPPEPKDEKIPSWLRMALPGLQELAVGMVAKGDEAKAQMVRNIGGAIMSGMMGDDTPRVPQPPQVAASLPPQEIVEVRRVAPKAMREVLAMLNDEEALAMEQMFAGLDQEDYLTVCRDVEELPSVDARLLWARRVIERMANAGHAEAPKESVTAKASPLDVSGVPAELMAVCAQLSPEDQMLGLQLLSVLDRGTIEKLVADLSGVPPEVALTTVRAMIAEARRRSPSVAHRAVAAALREMGQPPANGAVPRNGAASKDSVS